MTGLARLKRELIGKTEALDSPNPTVLDMDSTEIPFYGQQEQSACDGRFEPAALTRFCCILSAAGGPKN